MTRAPAIILAKPQLGENIGAAARAMANFGLSDLRLVAPRDGWPNKKATAMAADGKAVLETARIFETLGDALADLQFVLATTARDRGITKEVLTPAEGARRLRISGAKCGILFGNERAGLDNEEISLTSAVVTIPTADFHSLNLGQAVLLMAYEWFRAGDETPASRIDHGPLATPATNEEMQRLFAHFEEELLASGFLYPPDKAVQTVQYLRAMLHRAELTSQDVQTLRGVIVALARGKHRRRPLKE
ncbi:MAG TPA: RNA methyltransferase [Rhizomicrobium sp.]|nr:RNA methyltransferase [Rhizomicrobium sp.]